MVEATATFREPQGNPLVRWGLIAVGVLAAIALLWYLYSAFTGVTGVKVDAPPPQSINMLPPPPPPPPPPPKPEEKPPEPTETPEPVPEAAATPKPDAPAPMTMNADAQAGAGTIASGSGGGMGSTGSTGTCVINCGGGIGDAFYARSLSSALQQRIQRDSKLSPMVFTADFAIWVNGSGAVTRADMIRSSGDEKRDAQLRAVIEGASGLTAPPPSFKFPRRVTVSGRRSL